MFRNYLLLAWRNITKYRFYSAVNIIGLCVGILFVFLIGAYIWGELQVNKQLNNPEQQYILTTVSTDPNIGYELATFGPIAKLLHDDYPNLVENYYRWDGITSVVSKGDKNFREGLQVGDSTLLKMYGFKTVHGNAATALNDPFSVVITEEKAIKYFGKSEVLGETVTIQSFSGEKHDFKITAVLKNLTQNSVTHLTTDYPNSFFIPTNTLSYFGRQGIDSWNNMFIASFIELKKGASIDEIQKVINQMVQQNADPSLQKIITVQPVLLTDYYLQKDKAVVKRMLYALSFVGLFILLMAIVNFISIAISRSSGRMREIGIRKVLGGLRGQLILQFLVESIALVSIATILALVAYPMIKPVFNQVVGKELPALSAFPLWFIALPVIIIVLVGLLAGLYPAFVLSAIQSVDSLKGKLKTVSGGILLRKSLVGFQFSLAIVVLVAAYIVAQQVAFFFGQQLGYNKEYVVSAQVPRDWTKAGAQKMLRVRDEFARLPQVSNISLSYEIPNGANAGQAPVYKYGADSTSSSYLQVLQTDENYLTTYQIPLVAGNFFEGRGLDSGKVVINEKTSSLLGYSNAEDAVGQRLRILNDPTVFTVKGVVRDFHFGSMQQSISPSIFFNVNFSPNYRFFSFKIKPGNVANSIATIQNKWPQLLPGSSFEYSFMDDSLKKLYATEIQLKKAAYMATLLAFIIVLLGVLGLVSLSIHKRIKEIGIRKVLGASMNGIVYLFIKEFILVISFAGLVACPFAWIIMKNWLDNYSYRIPIGPLPFIFAIGVLCAATFVLIIVRTAKAATINPIKSLRTE